MKFSAFSKLGHYRLTSQEPPGRRIYDALIAAYGGDANFDTTFDGQHHTAKLYAIAMALSTLRRTTERAQNNAHAMKATEMLPHLEAEYRITPASDATLWERRAALAVKMLLTRGCRPEAVENALRLILGSLFVAYHPIDGADAEVWPAAIPADGSFKRADSEIKIRTLDTAISVGLGAAQWVDTTHLGASENMLLPGEVITVEPGRFGCFESVTIAAVSGTQIQTTFTKAHEPDSIVTTACYPFWCSTYRHNLVVCDTSLVEDAETRRQVWELLERVLRAVSTWTLCTETTPGSGTVGPFTVGDGFGAGGLIGITPIGTLTL